jgi:hypothetical protein
MRGQTKTLDLPSGRARLGHASDAADATAEPAPDEWCFEHDIPVPRALCEAP